MANKQPTFFQRMNRFFGSDVSTSADYTRKNVNTYKINDPKVLFATKDKAEYDAKALELRQNKLLNWKWRKANAQISNEQYMNITDVKMMYRDADLMDGFPEFGTAADLIMEEACYTPNTGKMVNVFSKSTRIKAILEDLLYNRLQINVTLPMIARCMVKYGNCFMLHDIDINNGLRGWRQLPVYEVERYENMASDNPYYSYFQNVNNIDLDREGVTRFVWVGQNEFTPYWNWQISHFRLLYDSISLPFGTSFFNKARRHFRMLSMMEDAMLMYRLERAVERRVFKVNVAAIDEDDVPAYIEDIANEFKRTPIVDPLTGQLDLRRNILPVWKKTPIPLLDGRVITIEELAREYENGKTNYVYSVQDETQQIVPGRVAWCGKNYTAKKMIKVTLDDGGYVVLAPEHEFIMRDGTRKRADDLCVGESVMPFYSEIHNEEGEKIYNPKTGKYEFTDGLVVNDINEGKTIDTLHHKDLNKHNNNPDNLVWSENKENEKFCNKTDNSEYVYKNHEVTNIDYIDGDDVYCMTVLGLKGEEDRHNFAVHSIYDALEQNSRNDIVSGCFVANCQMDDFFIPTRDPNEPSPIETLPAAQNLTALDDIKYVLNKILIALRIPKPFLNFEESTGDGKNLSLMDVRFMRTINRIQQALLMELNKACIIHLAILGFADDLTNFSLTMNNPSSQAEMLEIENLAKKITTAKDAVTDNGNGIPLYSCVRAWKEILGWSEKEISDNLEELRLEAALAAELQKTGQIIKRTGLFDAVDNIYGEPGAEYGGDNGGEEEDDGMMGGGGGGGASFGGDFDLGGEPEGEDIEGSEGEMSMDQAAAEAADENAEGSGGDGGGMEMLSEAILNRKLKQLKDRKKVLQKDSVERARIISEKLIRKVNEKKRMEEERYTKIPLFDKSFFVNEELDAMSKHLEAFLKERKASDEE